MPWPPEPENFEPIIEAARAGDVGEAAHLLFMAAVYLEHGWPLPDPLRLYLIDAFRRITNTAPSDVRPSGTVKDVSDLRALARRIQETRDANAVLNLKRPRGRKRSARAASLANVTLALEVKSELDQGKNVEQAVGAVADRMGVSDRTVSRAWGEMKTVLTRDG